MKFILFVEGHTEDNALPEFLNRCLNEKLTTRVGVKSVRFEGWHQLVKDAAGKVHEYLNQPKGLMTLSPSLAFDLYGPTFYPPEKSTSTERYNWAKAYMEKQVGHAKFRQFFAVHETEAWLLSDPTNFPFEIEKALIDKYPPPEEINFDRHPKKAIERIVSPTTQAKLY